MIMQKKTFFTGSALLAGFLGVLLMMFMPLFGGGRNALNYLDNLYNSISKGSAYYISGLKQQNKAYTGREIDVVITLESAPQAENTAVLLRKSGAKATAREKEVTIRGDLGAILAAALDDADLMFFNNEDAVRGRYGRNPRQVLYDWWASLKAIDKGLTRQKHFEAATFVTTVQTRAVECAYNYLGIQPQKIGEKVVIVILSLAFYVLYTLWFGYAIMFLFEGWGMDLGH